MKTSFFLFLFFFSIQLFAQEENKSFDIRFGIGASLLGTGDMRSTSIENEINYRLSEYFTTGLSVNFGRSSRGVYETASYLQGNINIFYSPFKNTGRNDFRMGTGVSLMNVSDARLVYARYNASGDLLEVEYGFDVRNSCGFNAILENTYSISNKLLLGAKLFTQPYFNGDINSGILLKFGIRI